MLAQRQNALLVSGRQVPATQTDALHILKSSRVNARSVPGKFIKISQKNSQSLNFSVVYVQYIAYSSDPLFYY